MTTDGMSIDDDDDVCKYKLHISTCSQFGADPSHNPRYLHEWTELNTLHFTKGCTVIANFYASCQNKQDRRERVFVVSICDSEWKGTIPSVLIICSVSTI